MKTRPSFALGRRKNSFLGQEKLENGIIILTLAITSILSIVDMATDLTAGEGLLHLSGEMIITLLSIGGMIVLWRRKMSLDFENFQQAAQIQLSEDGKNAALAEAARWKNEASQTLKGLSEVIDAQLSRWHLTIAEKEVALLLLKGLSLKEVANLRGVSEKTARSQSFSVYSKSGLSGRAELSAFFLEDIMLPPMIEGKHS